MQSRILSPRSTRVSVPSLHSQKDPTAGLGLIDDSDDDEDE